MAEYATVSDVKQMMEELEKEGYGDYTVTCNQEYYFAKKGEKPEIGEITKMLDFGGYV